MRGLLNALALAWVGCGGQPAAVDEPEAVPPVLEEGEIRTEELVLDPCFGHPMAHTIGACVHAVRALDKMAPHFVVEDEEEYRELLELVEKHHIGFLGMDPSEQPEKCVFPEIDFTSQSLIGQKVHSGHLCNLGGWDHEVKLVEKKYVFDVTIYGKGHCKGKPVSWWIILLVPRLPGGHEVEFGFDHVFVEDEG
jgi:hypothetical protein